MTRAFITGLSGLAITANERAFLHEAHPWGLIIFKRNVSDQKQVSELTNSFRDAVGWSAPILVDQEGGRVQRLGPPHWPAYPAGAVYGALYDRNPVGALAVCRLAGRLISNDLNVLGLDVDCLPLADVLSGGADPVIGDRAYGSEPGKVAAIASAIAEGLLAGGVLPVVKHLPGHGRATVDSHHKLPVVDIDRATLEATDFAAFRPLAGLPLGMTAHVVFSAIDPDAPATTSVTMVREVIRRFIGFRGLLMSDDVSMKALSGTIAERSRAAFAAGCDVVLHCNGDLAEMTQVAGQAPTLAGEAAQRAEAALVHRKAPEEFDVEAARKMFTQMVASEAPQRKTGAGDDRRCRGLRGSARSLAGARAHAEGRSRQDLDPGARRSVSQFHRSRAAAAA
jgi:beta-N-acetylhexosaminidase